jgi:hypothetical protein
VVSAHRDLFSRAIYAVLGDLAAALGEYRNFVVLVGGNVPELLLPDAEQPPVATMDIDFAVDPRLPGRRGRSLGALLRQLGFVQARSQPARYQKQTTMDGEAVTVCLDLLTSEPRGRRHERSGSPSVGFEPGVVRLAGIEASALPGFQLVFDSAIDTPLPGRPGDVLRTVSLPVFLVLKGLALGRRGKAKDACDIHYCLEYYPGGPDGVATLFRPLGSKATVRRALEVIGDSFSSPNAQGCLMVVNGEEITDPEARAMRQRGVYERVDSFLRALGERT